MLLTWLLPVLDLQSLDIVFILKMQLRLLLEANTTVTSCWHRKTRNNFDGQLATPILYKYVEIISHKNTII